MSAQFRLADPLYVPVTGRLRVNFDAPLPLGYVNAISRALELREHPGFTYRVIADVMREYHGFDRLPSWWADHLKAAGADRRPRGIPFNGPVRGRYPSRSRRKVGT